MNLNQQFVEAICIKADSAIKEGNPALLNRIASQPAVKHYYDNVFKLKVMTYENWVRDYPANAAELNAMRETYDAEISEQAKIAELAEGLASVGERLDKLAEAIAKLNLTPEAVDKAVAKAKTKSKAKAADPEEESGDEEDGEE